MKLSLAATALSLVGVATAHIALWDEAMYGYDPIDPNSSEPTRPLRDLPFSSWWFHGHLHHPPAPDKYMVLPSGGTYTGEVSCNKAFTSLGVLPEQRQGIYACPKPEAGRDGAGTGAMHAKEVWDTPVDELRDVTGCAIAIAYESDPTKIKPEDFVVISTNHTCPWFKKVDFQIPDDLPECPEGGCTCLWGWVHSSNGGAQENYILNYRCKVEGAKGTRALPKLPRKCEYPTNTSNCTVGAKQPIYWMQLEQNNIFQGDFDPPYYNGSMVYMNGAQTDLFVGIEQDDDQSLRGQALVVPVPSSSTSHAAPAATSTPPADDAKMRVQTKVEGKGKSGKVCKRHGKRSMNGHKSSVAARGLAGSVATPPSMVRRMDVVAGQARRKGMGRKRDSTAV